MIDPTTTRTSTSPETVPRGGLRWIMSAGLLLPVTFVMSMDRTAIVVAAPAMQDDLHFSVTQMGVILTAFWWTYALFQVPGGVVTRRLGPRKSLALAGLVWSVFTFITPYGVVFLGFVAIRAVLGMGQAADWPASVNMLHRWFPDQERSRGNSFLLCGLYLGHVVGTPMVVWIIDSFGWPHVFHVFGVLGAILALVWLWQARDEPRQHPHIRETEVAHIEAGRTDTEPSGQGRSATLPWRAFFGSGQFWAVALQYMFLLLIQGFFANWLPTYLVQARGTSLEAMGWLASLPWVTMLVGVFGIGALNDRLLYHWRGRVWLAVAGYVVAAGALALGALLPNVVLMMVFLCLSMGAVGAVQVQVWAACQDLGGEHSATVSGWTNMWGNLMQAAGPLFTGVLVGIGGNWSLALLVLAIAGLLGAVCWFFVHPERPLQVPNVTT